MIEEWRAIEGYDGLYEVSNLGRVRSNNFYRFKEPHIISSHIRKDGYKTLALSKNNVTKTYTVHRLVANAFLPNPNNLEMINHKDEDRSNNCVENLEWCSRSYNQLYSLKLHPERRYVFGNNFKDKKTGKFITPMHEKGGRVRTEPIVILDKEGNIQKRFKDSVSARDETGIHDCNIYSTCVRNSANHLTRRKNYVSKINGFIFCFDNEVDIEHTRRKLV